MKCYSFFVVIGCETFWNLQKNDGDNCLSQGRVYEWVEICQNRRQNVSDEHGSGRPGSVAIKTVEQQIEQWIRNYRRVTIDETAVEFNMSNGAT